MSDSDAKLLVLHGFSPEGDTWLSFREPNETQIAGLCRRLVEDRYDKPFLVEDRKTRSLCFGIDGAVQSEMWLDDPESLVSAYTRKMMGFLLFRRRPREILMIGLGGGSLAKFCHRHLPSARMSVQWRNRIKERMYCSSMHSIGKGLPRRSQSEHFCKMRAASYPDAAYLS